jgi:hypothetical protein
MILRFATTFETADKNIVRFLLVGGQTLFEVPPL